MESQVQGTIVKIMEAVKGVSNATGNDWINQTFVIDTKEEYDNLIAFEVFGQEKVDKLNQYNKIGDIVDVKFNIRCNEHQGRYYIKLSAWSIFKADAAQDASQPNPAAQAEISKAAGDGDDSGLPF